MTFDEIYKAAVADKLKVLARQSLKLSKAKKQDLIAFLRQL